jgi:hypothetical protein
MRLRRTILEQVGSSRLGTVRSPFVWASDRAVIPPRSQGRHDRILHARFLSQPDEPVSVAGVRGPLDPIEGERDALSLADRNQPGIEFL